MREQARRSEWRRWKRDNPEAVDLLRHCCRLYCDSQLAKNPCWVPNRGNQLPRFLKDLDIDDEYMNIKPHSFLTVRLSQSANIVDVYKRVKDLKYGWLAGGEAVLEDFGTHNPHFHLLLPRKLHKGNIIRQLAHRFKVSKNFVDYKQSDCPEVYQSRQNYLRGVKQEKKAEKVAADVEHRNANNIPHLINFD